MEVSFGHLVHRFGPIMQDKLLYIAGTCPDIVEGGFDVDLVNGRLKFRDSGREMEVQVIGSEAEGNWMWAHHIPSFPDPVVELVGQLEAFGAEHDEQAFQVAGFKIPEWEPGQLLSGMSCAAIVAGLGNADGIYCCHDRQNDRRLWLAMYDEGLREPEPPNPLERIVFRFPKILALSNHHPHQGGLTLVDWILALDGYCCSLGVEGGMDGDDMLLEFEGKQARASFGDEGVSFKYKMTC